jgi:hypothetical protein
MICGGLARVGWQIGLNIPAGGSSAPAGARENWGAFPWGIAPWSLNPRLISITPPAFSRTIQRKWEDEFDWKQRTEDCCKINELFGGVRY